MRKFVSLSVCCEVQGTYRPQNVSTISNSSKEWTRNWGPVLSGLAMVISLVVPSFSVGVSLRRCSHTDPCAMGRLQDLLRGPGAGASWRQVRSALHLGGGAGFFASENGSFPGGFRKAFPAQFFERFDAFCWVFQLSFPAVFTAGFLSTWSCWSV